MPRDHVHFNGSVNLSDTETVMREITARVPSGVRRIPDGETGDRGNWIFFQMVKFLASPQLESAQPHDNPADDYELPQVRLAEGVDPADMEWPDPGYADAYLESYATFTRLRDEGVIPAGVPFQVEYPTPLASISAYVVADQQEALLDSYEQAIFADLDRLLAALPHDDVAVQWDVAVEFGLLEQSFSSTESLSFDAIAARLARCVDQVPGDLPVGLHLCYGDYQHQHFKQPESLGLQVRVLNAVSAAASRPINFVSFTVPQNYRDAAYFAPLRELDVDLDTELNFALVPYHPKDQPPGTTEEQARLIDEALGASPGGARAWGICTECGMGRVQRDDVAGLLDLHREISNAS